MSWNVLKPCWQADKERVVMLRMQDLDLENKRVLIREDLNVPLKDGSISSDARLRAALPTIRMALEKGAQVMVMSHLGRPQEGVQVSAQPEVSLAPVAGYFSKMLDLPVPLVSDYLDGYQFDDAAVPLVLFENVRVNVGEKSNDESLARKLASLCDVFVMDAFGTAHRAQASTEGVARYAPLACAGPLLTAELDALATALANPRRPLVAIVGGSKVSTKLEVLDALAEKVDTLIVGGGIANTFLAAAGHSVGASLCEHELLDQARELAEKTAIPLPVDVVVAEGISDDAVARTADITAVQPKEMILDIGPASAESLAKVLAEAGTIIWNGPVGVFEYLPFAAGTKAVSEAIASSPAFSIAGGGDTLAAIDQFGVTGGISYISTGGGAFLEFVEGKILPAVAALEARAAQTG